MARRRSRGRSADTNVIASSPLQSDDLDMELLRPVEPLEPLLSSPLLLDPMMPELPHDRREFSFVDPETPRMITSQVLSGESRVGVTVGNTGLSPNVRVEKPHQVSVCVRRQERREVLHAMRRVGRGGGKRRRNEWSKVHCK